MAGGCSVSPFKLSILSQHNTRNLTKVFCKESGPPLVNSLEAYEVNYSDPESASASARKARAVQITDKETIEEILDDRTIECSAGVIFMMRFKWRRKIKLQIATYATRLVALRTPVEDREWLQQIQSSAKGFEGTVRNRGTFNENNNQQMEEYSQGILTPRNRRESPTKNHFNPEIPVIDEVKDHRPPITSKMSLPQWTDDQLDELFACEDDDV